MDESNWPAWHCPSHGDALLGGADELRCPRRHAYAVGDGIPRFVAGSTYAAPFGTQWKQYRVTQLDSHLGFPLTEDRTRRCLGEDLWAGLDGKHVLECGCGAGRFSEILLGRGARVTSIDLTEAVEANQENFPQDGRHRIALADIQELPFAPRQYDVVFCLGVIQHTPTPEATIARLYDQVKPGGSLVIDHYTHTLSWYTKTAPLIRRYLRRLPPDQGMRATEAIVDALLPLHERTRHWRVGQQVLSRLSPVQYYGQAFPTLDDDHLRQLALLDTHDSLTDWHKHRLSRRYVAEVLAGLGLDDIWCEPGGNGVEARGRRPIVATDVGREGGRPTDGENLDD